ncbi:MAG: PilZ domain-containing protein [Candidatus Omnitrophica bacterium]|nr:PilZ domain-containing protein [Candidatus Omnitrophota bacterium]MBU4487443.1 PilZ domain-containing protein [Candidatus Omnitrophota bacterium]MCG2705079.1 PilZ domain-containing protein [Candidatus Omnitrophota bacterium]
MDENYRSNERRKFLRCNYEKDFSYNTVNLSKDKRFMSSLINAIGRNLSGSGMLFSTTEVPTLSSLLVLNLDYRTARVCEEIEKNALIINNRILGKVVRIEERSSGEYDVGIVFVTKSDRLPKDIQSLIN